MTFPYVPSGGIITSAISQFRKALPPKVDAETLKKLGVAPSNEGYVIATMKFLDVIGNDNARTPAGHSLFTTHGDDAFSAALEAVIHDKYSALFEIRGDEGWTLDRDALISFFRGSDKTTEIVGARQATTFMTLAALAGKREGKSSNPSKPKPAATPKRQPKKEQKVTTNHEARVVDTPADPPATVVNSPGNVGLTVRIEINLPANGSQATYDNIFKSMRENLLKQNA